MLVDSQNLNCYIDFTSFFFAISPKFGESPKYIFAFRQNISRVAKNFAVAKKKKKDRKINITIYILRISQYLLCTNASPLQHNFFGTLGVIFPCGVIELLVSGDLEKKNDKAIFRDSQNPANRQNIFTKTAISFLILTITE